MEIFAQLVYTGEHATPWNARAAGKAASAGHPFVQSGEEPASHRTSFEGFCEFSVPVASGLPGKRCSRNKASSDARPSSKADRKPKTSSCPSALEWPSGFWVSNRFVDPKPGSPDDCPRVWRSIPSQSRLEAPCRVGVELPETGTTSVTKKRGRDCSLETVPLAPYKKTPTDLGPIWSSSMNRASCSFRTSRGLGLPKGRRPFITIFTNKIVSRPSVLWPYRRNGGVWPSTFNCGLGMSPAWISALSSKLCFVICAVQSFDYGTEEPSIGGKRSNNISESALASRRNISQPMHRNSIRQNIFGPRRTVSWPTVRPRTWQNSRHSSEIQLGECESHRGSFGHVFMPLICLGQDNYFHYLYKTQ